MTTSENGRPQFTNRIKGLFGDDTDFGDDISDYVPEPAPAEVLVSREFFADYKSLVQELRDLYLENAALREEIRSLDLKIRGHEIDIQAARFELAKVNGEKLKRLRERAAQ